MKINDRIKILCMPNDPDPIESGSLGTITGVNLDSGQVYVDWDNGRSLHLIIGVDMFVINPKEDPLYNESISQS